MHFSFSVSLFLCVLFENNINKHTQTSGENSTNAKLTNSFQSKKLMCVRICIESLY